MCSTGLGYTRRKVLECKKTVPGVGGQARERSLQLMSVSNAV